MNKNKKEKVDGSKNQSPKMFILFFNKAKNNIDKKEAKKLPDICQTKTNKAKAAITIKKAGKN